MKYFRMNLNYENELYGRSFKKKFNDVFDYMLFWCQEEQSTLITENEFSDDYLNYIQNYTDFKCLYSKSHQLTENWWGKLKDYDVERKLNSKVFLNQCLRKNNLLDEKSAIVGSIKELKEMIQNNNNNTWILKKPTGFSGIGNFILTNNEKIPKIEEYPIILEEYHKRIIDFGSSFKIENNKIHFKSINSNLYTQAGQLKGSVIFPNENHYNEIYQSFSLDKNNFIEKQLRILKEYAEQGAEGDIQVDSYLYIKDGIVKIRPLVEVNYRKTFSHIFNCFKKFIPQQSIGLFLICGKNELIHYKSFEQQRESLSEFLYTAGHGVLPLSPISRLFECYLLVSTENSMQDLLAKFVETRLIKEKQTSFRKKMNESLKWFGKIM